VVVMVMKQIAQISFFLGSSILAPVSLAQNIQPMVFSHGEWEIACSNIGTCRAAGFQSENTDEDLQPASILITRKAGERQPVKIEYLLSNDEELSIKDPIRLWLNGQDYGVVSSPKNTEELLSGEFNGKQVQALLKLANQNVKIEFKNKTEHWIVSDAGMTAVLLKMDDFQKRIGTIGALIRKGTKNETGILKSQPKTIVKRVKTDEKEYLTLAPHSPQYNSVLSSLITAKTKQNGADDNCEGTYDSDQDGYNFGNIQLYKLSHQRVLATMLCWRGAYNAGYGAWVLNESLQGPAVLVTDSMTDLSSGELYASHKGRGLGDCWSHEQWIWNGQNFIHTEEGWTGACKGFAGGAWSLEKIETDVR